MNPETTDFFVKALIGNGRGDSFPLSTMMTRQTPASTPTRCLALWHRLADHAMALPGVSDDGQQTRQ
jgi:hypothetical protein